MGSGFTHLDESGAARMVDVSGKAVSARSATASGFVLLSPECVAALREGVVPKGDAIAVARIAGIQAAKRTPDLVPLCHPIAIHGVAVDLEVRDEGVEIAATVRTADRTGVEMEALTCVTVAALALIDMVKAVDPAAVITDVCVEEKLGGKTGAWHRPEHSRTSSVPGDEHIASPSAEVGNVSPEAQPPTPRSPSGLGWPETSRTSRSRRQPY